MTEIAFLLLCHKEPEAVIAQVRALVAAGDRVVVHHDANAPALDHERLRAALAPLPGVVFTPRRHACGWGDWSLVAATLTLLRAALREFPGATHFYLLSGDCRPIKSAAHVHAALVADPADHIESVDFFTSGWIRTGMREERLVYRHWFNERRHPRLFYAALALQRRLGLRRRLPRGLEVMIGSQWWCLRRATAEAVLAFLDRRPDVLRFFRRSWIPDETLFQTLVRHLVPAEEIRSRSPTFHLFTDYGMPVNFHDDHEALLLAEDRFFARKISTGARGLRARLDLLWASGRRDFAAAEAGARQFAYLTGQGRIGLRHGPRAWERGASLGAGRALLVIACKKWHVGRRLAERLGPAAGLPAYGYVFQEAATPLPDLGGIEHGLARRNRHRRAVLRLLFDRAGADRLAICLDPHDLAFLRDIATDAVDLRLLELDCRLDPAFLSGHAARIGLIGPATPPALAASVTEALAEELAAEAARLRGLALPARYRLREGDDPAEMAIPLAAFACIPTATAAGILAEDDLFAD